MGEATALDAPLLLSPERAAQRLDVSRRTVYALIREGHLPAVRVSTKANGRGTYRVRPEDLLRYVERLRSSQRDERRAIRRIG